MSRRSACPLTRSAAPSRQRHNRRQERARQFRMRSRWLGAKSARLRRLSEIPKEAVVGGIDPGMNGQRLPSMRRVLHRAARWW